MLTFILDTIATADELGLPYSYQNEFQFGNVDYTLYEDGDYRSLKKVGEPDLDSVRPGCSHFGYSFDGANPLRRVFSTMLRGAMNCRR